MDPIRHSITSGPAADVPEFALQIGALAEPRQIDEAMDFAARMTRATVGEFVAAPGRGGPGELPGIEAAVEFFVPPHSTQAFTLELDRALVRRSMQYNAARRGEQVGAIHLHVMPPGTFAQWRSTFNRCAGSTREARWGSSRELLDGILMQARIGWRELIAIG